MNVKDCMTPAPVTVSPATSIARAQETMLASRIRHLPVVDNGVLVGILSDRDIRTVLPSPATSFPIGELRYLLDRLKVRDVMTRSVITVGPEEPLGAAVQLMVDNKFGSLPVVSGDRLIAIITDLDLLRAFGLSLGAVPASASRPTSFQPRAILVPLDGTSGSEAVLDTVGERARLDGFTVRLLHVAFPVHELYTGERIVAYADQETSRVQDDRQRYLRHVAARLGDVPVECVVEFGDPVGQIVRHADGPDIALVAMATHRRTGLARVVWGSVAERVERLARVPVMLVPYGAESAA